MRRMTLMGIGCVLAVMVATLASAAVAPRGPKDMKKDASHVVVGTVQKVFMHQEVVKEFGGAEARTTYISQIKIESVEKGAGVSKDDVVYVKTWKHKWQGPGLPPPGNTGHWHVPKKGERVQVYYSSLKGLNHVLLQSGMKAMPKTKAPVG